MKTTFSLALLIAKLATSASAPAMRGRRLEGHRRLEESTCSLSLVKSMYEPTEDYPNGYSKDSWSCELSYEDSIYLGVESLDIVEESAAVKAALKTAIPRHSTMTVSEAIVDINNPVMYIPESARIKVQNNGVASRDASSNARMGPTTTGTHTALMIRLTDSKNRAPMASVAQLEDDVFLEAVSLKSQMEDCSYNKLNIKPFVGKSSKGVNIENGVVELKLDFETNNDEHVDIGRAIEAAKEHLGDWDDFDLVMFCYPEGALDALGAAYVDGKVSWYKNKSCSSPETLMHEIGHNLGLGHSREDGIEYGDLTGNMGGAVGGSDTRKCYNPQKSYQLGWYKDKTKTINPHDGNMKREFILNGVSDYKKNKNALVVLRLEQTKLMSNNQQDFYVGFNRAEGMNQNTGEDANKVTIVRKDFGAPDIYGKSSKFASLKPGETKVIKNFNGEGDVEIKFLSSKNGDAKIQVVGNDSSPNPEEECRFYTIKVNTDNHPEDTSWSVKFKEFVGTVAESPVYDKKNHQYIHDVCLNSNTKYDFIFEDSHGDGLCCDNGECCDDGYGLYKVYDDKGKKLHEGTIEEGRKDMFTVMVDDSGDPPPTMPPTQKPPCKNKQKGKFKVNASKGKKRCKGWAKKKKCNVKTAKGVFVWELCEKSCKKC